MSRAVKGVKGFRRTSTAVNRETGEMIELDMIVHYRIKTKYYTMNMENWDALSKRLTSITEVRLAHLLAKQTDFDTPLIRLTKSVRQQVRTELGIVHDSSFSTLLASLREKGILEGGQGEWYMNPSFLWRGSLKAREILLKTESGKELVQRFYRSKYDHHVNGSNTGGDSEEH